MVGSGEKEGRSREGGEREKLENGDVMHAVYVVFCMHCTLYAYTHTVRTGNHTLTHIWVSFVIDAKLDGMVPFKLLLSRLLLERGGKSEEGVESRSE